MSDLQPIHEVVTKINSIIEIQNNQTSISRKAWYVSAFFGFIILLAFTEIIEIHPAILMLSIFFLLFSVVLALMFRSREKKLQKLISGEDLIAHWTLNEEEKKAYIRYHFEQEKGKNSIILFSISFIALIVFSIFIAVIDEGKLFMFFVLLGLIALLSLFAFGMPYYYRYKNSKGDGYILIGKKYAYINGTFHNWDFPLSGLSKVKIIQKPFYGIHMTYYYTDRTFSHSEELYIPAKKESQLEDLVATLIKANKKRKKN